jgi:2-amino-4-hydroxy-6-hydroxymethyldihydropteridine diphosphokinase
MNRAYLLTGGNLGNRQQNLADACTQISRRVGMVEATSSLYETAAWGVTDQPSYLNQVVVVQTLLQPEALLQELLAIEQDLGRTRRHKYDARTIDIDILLYNHLAISLANLHIPHEHLHRRRFALQPLSEVAGNYVHPFLGKTILDLLEECTDVLDVKKFASNNAGK